MKLRLTADIVRIADGKPLGSVNLDTGAFATSDADLFAAWDRLRRDGVKLAGQARPQPLSRATLSLALVALRTQGFDWRLSGNRQPTD